jgi:hypothetical protein
MRRKLIPSLLLLAAVASPAAAQERGGLGLSPEALAAGGPRGLARPLPLTFPGFTAADLQAMPTPAERRQRHQNMVAKVRGDGGFLEGFSFGQPRAASRQPPPPPVEPIFAPIFLDQRTEVLNLFDIQDNSTIVNRFEAPVAVTVGDGNVVQQQGAGGGNGPVAQQQVATVGGRTVRGPNVVSGGGASNLITPDGKIVQHAASRRAAQPRP